MQSPIATSTTVQTLEIVIARHNNAYQELYPNASYIPKLYYLIHLLSQIKMYGPARNHRCMCTESKNSFFMRKKFKNTKNISKTVSLLHQQWMCCMQHENSGSVLSRFLMLPPISKPGVFTILNEYKHARIVRQVVPFEPQS